MNKDQVRGRVEEVVGKVKEVTGKVIGNKTLERKGDLEEAAGKVRAGYGDAKSQAQKRT